MRFGIVLVALSILSNAAPLIAQDPSVVHEHHEDAPQAVAREQLRAGSEETLKQWLENMVVYHRFTDDEVHAVTGLEGSELAAKLEDLGIDRDAPRPSTDELVALPYPGGRHPRIGFLDGAIAPQRETKLSVFPPWDQTSYAVLDIPEAIWSNLGLTYLAHTHIDTIWSATQTRLPQLEWEPTASGYRMERTLPNGITFGTQVEVHADHLLMNMWLRNGTTKILRDLRVQNCVMLKGMAGFEQQSNASKSYDGDYALAHDQADDRWIITAWSPLHRGWANEMCPCLHADPKFPDCPPGETSVLQGWFSFYEGNDIQSELRRIDRTGWRTQRLEYRPGNLSGRIVEAETGKPMPCRLYIKNLDTAEHHFARSARVGGDAVVYDKQMGQTPSIEKHTCISADPFWADLPPGRYLVTAAYGKEYLEAAQEIRVDDAPVSVELRLQRFADMKRSGWYSGDIHVHRELAELPTVMRSEDLNVTLPLMYWVRDSTEIPSSRKVDIVAAPQEVDVNRIIYPVNTEYEIFSVAGKRHTQGAVFVLNHQRPLDQPAPPVRPIARQAELQRGVLDLDKHSWNWSMMIVPIMEVDLFELGNNHHWRTQFGFPAWTIENAPREWTGIETDENGFTERGWTEFGFRTYYALLNCGFRLRVSAGTASGVHPVPLGHSRVYVHLGNKFSYRAWIMNLNAGQSFVTQGPLVNARINGRIPGSSWVERDTKNQVTATAVIRSARPLTKVELIANGEVVHSIRPQAEALPDGGFRSAYKHTTTTYGSTWLAIRCFESPRKEDPADKVIFAHTNPVYLEVPRHPTRPRRSELEYFIRRIDEEIVRNTGVLSEAALAEFREAKQIYVDKLQNARP